MSHQASDVYREMEGKMKSPKAAEEVVWGFVEGAATIVDGAKDAVPISGVVGNMARFIVAACRGAGAMKLLPNPYFCANGQGEGNPCTATWKYLLNRRCKNIGASVAGTAGALASIGTRVNVARIAQHGSAVVTTSVHLARFKSMAQSMRDGGTLCGWLELLIRMKKLKLTARSIRLAGAAIPIPAAGIASGLLATAVATGAKITMSKACLATSLQLHWRGRQEQVMLGGRVGTSGPALGMVHELFTKRGLTWVLGSYDVDAFVSEPTGWHAIFDKLMLA